MATDRRALAISLLQAERSLNSPLKLNWLFPLLIFDFQESKLWSSPTISWCIIFSTGPACESQMGWTLALAPQQATSRLLEPKYIMGLIDHPPLREGFFSGYEMLFLVIQVQSFKSRELSTNVALSISQFLNYKTTLLFQWLLLSLYHPYSYNSNQ